MGIATSHTWEQVAETAQIPNEPDRYVELPESGWGALIAWLAEPAQVVRVPDGQDHVTAVSTSSGDGQMVACSHPRDAAEDDLLNDDIDHYLREADAAPSRPRGYRWFLRLPVAITEARFWEIMNSVGADSHGPVYPRVVADHVRRGLRQMAGGHKTDG